MLKRAVWAGVLVVVAVAGACNDVGDCPAASAIQDQASCSGEQLECPYTLQTASPACDGTMVDGGLATSCVCTSGKWSCPQPVSCAAEGGTADDGSATDDGSSAGDGAASSDGSPGYDGAGAADAAGAGD